MIPVSSSQICSETVWEECDDRDISIWMYVCPLGANLLNVTEVCSSSWPSLMREKDTGWPVIQFTLCGRIWHDTKFHSIDAFPNKDPKWPPLPPPYIPLNKHLLLYRVPKSGGRFWPCCHGFSSVMGQDMCLVYILWDAERREGGLVRWFPLMGHSSVWDVCFCLFFSG